MSQTNCRPLVEGFRRPSLRSGLLNPSTKGRFHTTPHLSPFELAAVPFCSRPDNILSRAESFAEDFRFAERVRKV